MKEFTINSNDAGQRMDKFISKAVPLLPKNFNVQIHKNQAHKAERKAV